MREILFRAKRIDNGEWVEGFYILSTTYAWQSVRKPVIMVKSDLCNNCLWFDNDTPARVYEIDPLTIGQFAGLTDATDEDTKVFEGDVVSYYAENGDVFDTVVKYEAGMFILVSNKFDDGYSPIFDCSVNDGEMCWVRGKVIGNIHDKE